MVNNFVTVATFINSVEANLAKQRLEAEGIRCYLADESIVELAWHLSVAFGWIKLRVHQQDVELAKSILTSTELDSGLEPETITEDPWLSQSDEADDDIEKLSWADETADRAFRVAVIGLILIVLPLQLYSLWLLIRLLVSRRQISKNRQLKVIVALIFDLINLLIVWQIVT